MDPLRRSRRGGSSQTSSRTRSQSTDTQNSTSRASSTSRKSRASRRDLLEEQNGNFAPRQAAEFVDPNGIEEADLISLHNNDTDQTVRQRLQEVSVAIDELEPQSDDDQDIYPPGTEDDFGMGNVPRTEAGDGNRPDLARNRIDRVLTQDQVTIHPLPTVPRGRDRPLEAPARIPWIRNPTGQQMDQFGYPPEAAVARHTARPRGNQYFRQQAPEVELDEFGLPMLPETYRNDYRTNLEREDIPDLDELQERLDISVSGRASPTPILNIGPPAVLPLATSSRTMMAGDTAGVPHNTSDDSEVRRKVDCLLLECDDFCDAASGQKLFGDEKEEAKLLVQQITEAISSLMGRDPVIDDNRMFDLRKYRSQIKRKLITSTNAVATATAVAPPVVQNVQRPAASSVRNLALSELARKQIAYELTKLSEKRMIDIGGDNYVDPDDLKDILKVIVPDIKASTTRLRESIRSYATQPDADIRFMMTAQEKCEKALDWITAVEDRGRMEKLYLDAKQPVREVDFVPWSPNGKVSIYEFLSKFESWSRGVLTKAAQADALYSKHLDRSLVHGCKELEEKRNSYTAMRDWLIQKWGRASLVGDLYLSNITCLRLPGKSAGPEASATYLKEVFSNLVTVSTLEVSKGKPVSGLSSYITTNRWLKELYIALPRSLQKRFTYRLEDEDVELDDIEGDYYFQILTGLIKSTYKTLEANQRILKKSQPSSNSAAQSSQPQTNQVSNPPQNKKSQKTTAHAAQVQNLNNQQLHAAAANQQQQYQSAPQQQAFVAPAQQQQQQQSAPIQQQYYSSAPQQQQPVYITAPQQQQYFVPAPQQQQQQQQQSQQQNRYQQNQPRQSAPRSQQANSQQNAAASNSATQSSNAPPPAAQNRGSQGSNQQGNNQSGNGQQRQQQIQSSQSQAAPSATRFAPPIIQAPLQMQKGPRWNCPLKNHGGHSIAQCVEFWTKPTCTERRNDMVPGACFTCLGLRQGCNSGGCANAATTPQDLLCQDCYLRANSPRGPPNVMCCGLGHGKPTIPDLITRLEAWIPGFSAQALGAPIIVNFATDAPTRLEEMDDEFSVEMYPPPDMNKASSKKPPNRKTQTIFDTSTGSSRPVDRKTDIVVTPSDESVGYVMQLLLFKDQKVLTFYDSGANQNIVQAKLARDVGFFQLSAKPVSIGVAGGGEIVTNHGQYMAVLGPCQDGRSYSIDCQAVTQITRFFPRVTLSQVAEEARTVMPPDTCYPPSIGGDEVKLLVGIRQTELAPRLLHTLPSGVSIFESRVTDAYGSTVCFGGPHKVFTDAYRMLGINLHISSIMSMFTEVATAYLESPRAFVRDPPDVPFDKEQLLESRDPEPLDFTPAMLEIALEVSPELSLYQPKPGETNNLEEKLSEIISDEDTPEVTSTVHLTEVTSEDVSPPQEETSDVHVECYHSDKCSEPHSCYKALIPLSKLKGLMDELDVSDVTDFRCDVCSNCTVCRMSARLKTKSLQESFEQEVIEKSITLDADNDRVLVSLPFIRDPIEYLVNKHNGPDNLKQALAVYHSQCRRSPEVKEQLRKTHQDLVDQGFMCKMSDLSPEKQSLINKAEFRHYYLWRAVFKESSASTPVRLVVDPTATGLNCILAKGTNMLGRIPEVLLNFRANTTAWCSDISKMYNRLVLEDSALPYSLFLYHVSLDPSKPPDVYVMTSAWYGVSSTGNQANIAVDRLWETYAEEFPAAVGPLSKDRYMDDVDSGAATREEVNEQVRQVTECLKRGGFATKFVAHSGEPPPEKATVDGVSVGVLGIKWFPEEDVLGLNYSPMNIEKKVRGAKKVAKLDVTTPEGLRTAFQNGLITRAGALGRVAEFYDPVGWFEPLKLQMKLLLTGLNGLDWSDPVPPEYTECWVELFTLMESAREVRIPRCVIPEGALPKLRLLCVSDASDRAGGCAIYGGYKLPDGSYSCSLLCSRSKLMKNTVPRNELEAILLCSETALMVQAGLRERVEEVIYFSDSTIAICWVINTTKRLRMWVHNRVKEIRNAIKWVSNGEESVPLYYIQSHQNIADLVTKSHRPPAPWHHRSHGNGSIRAGTFS